MYVSPDFLDKIEAVTESSHQGWAHFSSSGPTCLGELWALSPILGDGAALGRSQGDPLPVALCAQALVGPTEMRALRLPGCSQSLGD